MKGCLKKLKGNMRKSKRIEKKIKKLLVSNYILVGHMCRLNMEATPIRSKYCCERRHVFTELSCTCHLNDAGVAKHMQLVFFFLIT